MKKSSNQFEAAEAAPVLVKKIIGYTTGSTFEDNVKEMIEHPDGLNAVALKIDQDESTGLKQVLDLCAGFVLIGGADIHPLTLNRPLTTNCGYSSFDRDRDKREIFLINYAEQTNKKILGICRGAQLLGALRGVYLSPNINGSDVCHAPSRYEIKTGGEPVHFVDIEDEFVELMGFEIAEFDSFHHQALNFIKDYDYVPNHGVEILGTAVLDFKTNKSAETRCIELFRDVNGLFLGAQMHIENQWDKTPGSARVLQIFKEMLPQ